MTVIAVGNQGGSAGKTTFVVNAAARLAEFLGCSVRVVDLDAQANASHWLGHALDPRPAADQPQGQPTVSDVLFTGAALADAARPVVDVEHLTVVPARRAEMEGADVTLSRILGGEQKLRMAIAADPAPPAITLIDCPGSLSTVTVAALVAADVAVTVFAPMEKEAGAVAAFEDTVGQVAQAYNPTLRLAAVVPSIVPGGGGRYYSDVLDQVRDGWGDLVTPPVRRSVRVPEAYSAQLPLSVYAPREEVTADLAAVVDHLLAAGVVTGGAGAAR
ncbi:Chromosome (plasmid) partitioning protein ParA / Sporulation initiation inhibitor protein Soj [Pseudonocardia sp. Ae717_Ps2]|uniref:ParA family protein n=1 Tax=Pseudonocardia sp. Ae717_Ps2 TaxID=1885573 RepID=UPI00094AFF6C|nr:ParA family protein [Pseudonocardia sp. Ae717_Ps2]OLM28277.1 Chromosome (plasmid) partitioning protein ParA / Sporulation initiation inhibitor protein Soj [Pseudonocardia sp. Ae717_Ps2]